MRKYVQMGLISLLIVLLYKVPEFLMNLVDNTIGKLILLCLCAITYDKYGYQTGLLAGLIVIVLLYQLQEGFINFKKFQLLLLSVKVCPIMKNLEKTKKEAFSNLLTSCWYQCY